MSDLVVAGVQCALSWEDAVSNRKRIGKRLESLDRAVDIIILPEMFTTGFSMRPQPVAEKMDGTTAEWMRSCAMKYDAIITGSVIIEENGKYFNRMLWITPDGGVEYYDKRHLFSLAGEDELYAAGQEIKIVEFKGWRINLNICYDLRFPVWSRNTSNYDCIIYVANWPVPRIQAWSTLIRARAIENQCYVIGINRIGTDENDNVYNGHSAIIDMEGKYLVQAGEEETILYSSLNKSGLTEFRGKFPFYRDADAFELKREA